ncbi:MAG: ParB/RepB/Spo0J family partition protein [Anaerolineaceae bacterium]|jgi:ParB family chromosome partitioning protein|nr:ParB/RepB/Spo0J family partition protein [Anaerolineaceae bacterium]MDD4042947.1 ParB/RepB/Spo0J family partition protein [Anaerolineaceae bacterium]MDD4577339.1 ParB/RepB/Spo0J family partition protein [Anaerolineaceae bacterium]
MAKKTGLGRGLDALIPGWEESPTIGPGDKVVQVPIANISPNPHQPRKQFDGEALEELAISIREHGIIQPLILIPAEEANRYTLIAGERRLRAAKIARLSAVPAIIRSATEQQQLEFAIIENVQREDLNPLERARAFQNLLDGFSLTHDEIAKRVGKSRVSVTNTLRLLNLPALAQKALVNTEIAEGHARALLGLPNERSIEAALETVISLNLNVRQTEALVNKMVGKPIRASSPTPRPAEIEDLENKLRQFFNTKVSLSKGARGGTISIAFYSDEELNAILDSLGIND